MTNPHRTVLAALAAVALAAPLRGQAPASPCFLTALTELRALATRADTLALAARYERQPPGGDQRCGKLVAGYAIGMTSTPAESEWRERQRGADLLNDALRSYADEPRLFLAMGILLYHRQARTDAQRMFDRALDRADRGVTPLTPRERALVHYNRGLMHQDYWRDWRSFGKLRATVGGQIQCGKYENVSRTSVTGDTEDARWLFAFSQVCPSQFDTVMRTFFEPAAALKEDEFHALEDEFSRAIAADPTFVEPAAALLSEYAYLGMWGKAEPLARALRARLTEDYRAYVYWGLVLHEAGRDSLAVTEFSRAFLYMPDSVAAVYDDISLLLLPEQSAWMTQADPQLKQRARHAFWNSLDPIYLTPANERKLEHYARVTAADLLFGSLALKERGWASFAGRVWIRYGRPRAMRELPQPGGRAVFWDYGPGPDVTFERGQAFRSFRPTDQALEYTNALARTTPQTYRGTQLIDSVKPLDRQIVRFRGADGRSQIAIYAEWPEGFTDGSLAGVFLLDPQFQPIGEWRGAKPEAPGLAVDMTGVPPGLHSVTVEVWDRATQRLGRVRDTVTASPVGDSLALSDVLLAASIRPLGEEMASRRDLRIEPLYGSILAEGRPLGLYWEIYGLKAAANGRARYDVTVELRDAGQRPIGARLLAGVGLGARSEAASKVQYPGSRAPTNGRVVEWLEIASELKPGTYRVIVTVADREAGVSRATERTVTVRGG